MMKKTLLTIAAATVLASSSAYQVATEITGTDEWYYSYPGGSGAPRRHLSSWAGPLKTAVIAEDITAAAYHEQHIL
jgi:hypothetical protein